MRGIRGQRGALPGCGGGTRVEHVDLVQRTDGIGTEVVVVEPTGVDRQIFTRIGGRPGASAYAGSKAAIDNFSTGFAREVAAEGIRVNTVRPGVTATGMTTNLARAPMSMPVVVVSSWPESPDRRQMELIRP